MDETDTAAKTKPLKLSRIQRARRLIEAADAIEDEFVSIRTRLISILPPSRYLNASLKRIDAARDSAVNALSARAESQEETGSEE